MIDITDPIVFSTVAQTAVLTLTLVIFIMSFRTQNKATKEAAYQKILDDYTDAIRLVLEKPELSKLQIDMARAINPGSTMASLSADDMTVRNYLVLLYGLFERTHLLYRRKWIDSDTWNQWSAFLNVRQAVYRLCLQHSEHQEQRLDTGWAFPDAAETHVLAEERSFDPHSRILDT